MVSRVAEATVGNVSAKILPTTAIDPQPASDEVTVWGTTDPAKHPSNLFVFLQSEYANELAVPATLGKLVASGDIPPAIAVILDTSTERPTDIANRAKFDRFVTANLLPWLRAKLGRLPEPLAHGAAAEG